MTKTYKHINVPPFVFDYVKMSIQFKDVRASSNKNYVLQDFVESDGKNIIKYNGAEYSFSEAHLIKRKNGFYIDLIYNHTDHRIHVRVKIDKADNSHASDTIKMPNSDIFTLNVDIDNLTKEMSVYRYYMTPKEDIIIDFQNYRVYADQSFFDKYNKILNQTVSTSDNYKDIKYIYTYYAKEGFSSIVDSKPLLNQIIDYTMFGFMCILIMYIIKQVWDTYTKD